MTFSRDPLLSISIQKHSEPIFILYLIYGFRIGGAEQHLLDLCKALDRQRFRPEIVYFYREEQLLPEFQNAGIPCHFFDAKGKELNFTEVWRLSRLIRNLDPDVVHVHLFHASRFGTLAAFLAGVKRIVRTKHSVRLPGTRAGKRDMLWNAFLSLTLTRTIGVSRAVAKEVKTSHVIYNGIDTEYFSKKNVDEDRVSYYSHKFGAAESPIIGIVARFSIYKGHSVLLEAFSELLSDWPDAKLLIAGDGETRSALERHVSQLGLSDHVNFLGMIRDVREFLAVLNIFVHPSVAEGLGISAIEAMSMELPVVATRVGGLSEVITDGENGILVEPNDSTALSMALDRILRDVRLCERLRHQARKTAVEKFGLKTMVDRYECLYTELCK